MRLKETFEELGLKEKEIALLAALIKSGRASASSIAKKAGLGRVLAYGILKSLLAKGFVKTSAGQGNVTVFEAIDEEEISNLLNRKKKTIEEGTKNIPFLYKQISRKSPLSSEPKIYYYEGKEGIIEAFFHSLKTNPKEVLSFSAIDRLYDVYDEEVLQKYWDERVRRKIPTRSFCPASEFARKKFTNEKNQRELRKIKYIVNYPYDPAIKIDIYGEYVSLTSVELERPHCIIVKSPTTANCLRQVFEIIWNLVP